VYFLNFFLPVVWDGEEENSKPWEEENSKPGKEEIGGPSQANSKPSQGKSLRETILYTSTVGFLLALCFGCSCGLSIFNKFLFSGPLPAPLFVTSFNNFGVFWGGLIMWQMFPSSVYTRTKIESWSMLKKLMIIPIAFLLNIGLNNLSLKYTTLALNQLVRAFSPAGIAFTSYLIEGKRQSFPKTATLLFLVFGVALGVQSSPDFEIKGILICFGSLLGQSLSIVMSAFVMQGAEVNFHPIDLCLYTTLPTIFFLLPWSYSIGEFQLVNDSIKEIGLQQVLIYLFVGTFIVQVYNIAALFFIRLTSSVYYGATTGFRCAVTIILSFHIFPQKANALTITGTVIAILAFIANSFLTMKEKIAQREKAESIKHECVEHDPEKQKLLSSESDDGVGSVVSVERN